MQENNYPHQETEPNEKQIKYPLTRLDLENLNSGDIIKKIPLTKVVKVLFSRVPDETIEGKNAYGTLGGDLIQHGNMRAINLVAEGSFVQGVVLSMNSQRETIRLKIDLPTFGNDKLWPGGKTQRTVSMPFSDFLGPLTKLKETFRR